MNTASRLDIAQTVDALVPVTRSTRRRFAASAWAPFAHTPVGLVAASIADVLAALFVVLCIPFAILAIGTPLALCARLLLWLTGSL